jgi:hypothetical protein
MKYRVTHIDGTSPEEVEEFFILKMKPEKSVIDTVKYYASLMAYKDSEIASHWLGKVEKYEKILRQVKRVESLLLAGGVNREDAEGMAQTVFYLATLHAGCCKEGNYDEACKVEHELSLMFMETNMEVRYVRHTIGSTIYIGFKKIINNKTQREFKLLDERYSY